MLFPTQIAEDSQRKILTRVVSRCIVAYMNSAATTYLVNIAPTSNGRIGYGRQIRIEAADKTEAAAKAAELAAANEAVRVAENNRLHKLAGYNRTETPYQGWQVLKVRKAPQK